MSKTNNQEQLAAVYSAANVFFNPTLEENYPTVNLEAEACGVPVVTFDTGGCKETIKLIASQVVNCYEDALAVIEAIGVVDV